MTIVTIFEKSPPKQQKIIFLFLSCPVTKNINLDVHFISFLNSSIAGEGAVMYHGVLIHIFDASNNFYVLNYEDLTELSLSFYSTLMIEKASTDRYKEYSVCVYYIYVIKPELLHYLRNI